MLKSGRLAQGASRLPLFAVVKWLSAGAVIGAALAGCTQSAMHSGATPLEAAPEVLFIAHDDGDLDLYVTNTVTNQTRKLTHNDRDDMHPVWSPDGNKIAYTSSEHGPTEIYVINSDGSNPERVTHDEHMDFNPAWSGDGKRLFFVSNRDMADQLFSYDLGTGEVTAVPGLGKNVNHTFPQVSPDGSKLAFVESEGKKHKLHVIDLVSNEIQMLVDDVSVSDYSWSADSRMIAYSGRAKRKNNIYLVDVEAAEITQLTDTPNKDLGPVWLPDGNRLAFISTQGEYGRGQVFSIDVDTKKIKRLSVSNMEEMQISVSPDGRELIFVRFENRFYHSQIMDVESGETHIVAAEVGRAHLSPSFRPRLRQ